MDEQAKLGIYYKTGPLAERWLRKAAEQGNITAQVYLGSLYEHGKGIPQNYAEAAKWYRKAAERGGSGMGAWPGTIRDAQELLGRLYRDGRGVEKDYKEAAKWFQKAAEWLSFSGSELSNLYVTGGPNFPQNYEEAYFWRNVHLNDCWPHMMMERNELVDTYDEMPKKKIDWDKEEKDIEEDIRRHLSKQQISNLTRRIQDWYPPFIPETEKIAKAVESLSVSEQLKKLLIPAEFGDNTAQLLVGDAYYNGQDVERNYTEAAKWYRKAADAGLAKARVDLGNLYYSGQGVQQDYSEAAKWFRLAAEQGNPSAQYNIGDLYANGLGVEEDHAEAVKWYRLAADQKSEVAQMNLAAELGDSDAQLTLAQRDEQAGTHEGDKEAYFWYCIAARQTGKNSLAGESLLRIGQRLSDAERQSLDQRVSHWAAGVVK